MNKQLYNEYRNRYINSPKLNLDVPVDVMLELASSCNLACGYCYHSKENKDNLPFTKGLMKFGTAIKILNQCSELGVNSLKFNYRGEGTLNPHYTEITTHAKRLARESTFIDRIANTNFQILPKFRDDKFKGLAQLTKVKISYDSFNKEVFEGQRIKGKHDLITENIGLFYNHPDRIKNDVEIVLQAVRTKANADEDFEAEAKKRWPSIGVSIRDMVDGRLADSVQDDAVNERDFENRQTCIQAHSRIIFTHEGTALPCCPAIKEDVVIGNINIMDVKQIFNSPFAKNLRKRLLDKSAFSLFDSCKNCSSYESFKGYEPNKES